MLLALPFYLLGISALIGWGLFPAISYYQIWGIIGGIVGFATFPMQSIIYPIVMWFAVGEFPWLYWLLYPVGGIGWGIGTLLHRKNPE